MLGGLLIMRTTTPENPGLISVVHSRSLNVQPDRTIGAPTLAGRSACALASSHKSRMGRK
jgi:hypothetical protein